MNFVSIKNKVQKYIAYNVILISVLIIIMDLTCADFDRTNPFDPGADNYKGPTDVVFTTLSLPDWEVNELCNYKLEASGCSNLYTWTIESGDLPRVLTLDSLTGVISGIPDSIGEFIFTVKASDRQYDNSTTKQFTFNIRDKLPKIVHIEIWNVVNTDQDPVTLINSTEKVYYFNSIGDYNIRILGKDGNNYVFELYVDGMIEKEETSKFEPDSVHQFNNLKYTGKIEVKIAGGLNSIYFYMDAQSFPRVEKVEILKILNGSSQDSVILYNSTEQKYYFNADTKYSVKIYGTNGDDYTHELYVNGFLRFHTNPSSDSTYTFNNLDYIGKIKVKIAGALDALYFYMDIYYTQKE